ncbi:uncharacterized protein ACNS7B_011261 [Menidia menidia]
MAASNYLWIASFAIAVATSHVGVFGRAVDTIGSLSRLSTFADESSGASLRADAHRERCAELVAPWQENTQPDPREDTTLLKVHVRPFSPGPSRGLVFPGRSLFSFVRRVYRCCQEGLSCRSVKGIQGRLRGDADVEFVFTREILSLAVMRAELHLKLSNPQHVDVRPTIPFMAKHNLPTRYSLGFLGDSLELRVDLLFLLQTLHEGAGAGRPPPGPVNMRLPLLFPSEALRGEKASPGEAWGEGLTGPLDVGLLLGCRRDGAAVPCQAAGLRLSHTPFMALYYRRS